MRNEISLNEEKNYQKTKKNMDWELADTKMEVTTLNNCFQFVQVCNFFYGRQVQFTSELRPTGHVIAS